MSQQETAKPRSGGPGKGSLALGADFSVKARGEAQWWGSQVRGPGALCLLPCPLQGQGGEGVWVWRLPRTGGYKADPAPPGRPSIRLYGDRGRDLGSWVGPRRRWSRQEVCVGGPWGTWRPRQVAVLPQEGNTLEASSCEGWRSAWLLRDQHHQAAAGGGSTF